MLADIEYSIQRILFIPSFKSAVYLLLYLVTIKKWKKADKKKNAAIKHAAKQETAANVALVKIAKIVKGK
jgi:UDP-2,3-diacylglucosamine pyrophosphatase LpxH